MKRGFIRGLWGIYSKENSLVRRRYKMDTDITTTVNNEHTTPYTTYVFGSENLEYLTGMGVDDCILMDENPAPFDLVGQQYRHKLEILKRAMEDFDEIVFIDWDCVATKALPDDFWEVMGEKNEIQANLQQYKRRKCFWRGRVDLRKLPNAGFLYIRDKSVPDEILAAWELKPGNSAEPPLARVMDDRTGGWVGADKYWDIYEPEFCNLYKWSVYDKQKLKTKRDQCFVHYQGMPS